MPTKRNKPTSPGRRHMISSTYSEVTKGKPEKSLLSAKPKSGGRNSGGRATPFNRGGGNKQRYRIIDFKRDKDGIEAKVAAIEYDPNRTCRIALLHYMDGEKRYTLAARNMEVRRGLRSGHGERGHVRAPQAPQRRNANGAQHLPRHRRRGRKRRARERIHR